MGALAAVEALADAACDADRGSLVSEVEPVGVDQPAGVADVASQPDGVLRRLLPGPRFDRVDRPGDGEEPRAVGHGGELGADLARRAEGVVHDPARAGAAEPGEVEPAPAETLRHVARVVDPDEEEGDTARALAAERGQAVADLLEAGAETALQDLDVVTQAAGRVEEPPVGHDDAAREIVGERETAEALGLRVRKIRALDVAVQQLAPRIEGNLDGELEAPRRRREQLRQQHAPAVEVVAPRGLGHGVDGEDAQVGAVRVPQVAGETAEDLRRIEVRFAPQLFGARLDLRKVVRPRLQVLAHLLDGKRLPAAPVLDVPARQPFGEDLGGLAQLAIGLVERKHGLGRRWAGLGDGPDVRVARGAAAEQGVAEHLLQPRIEPGIVVFGEFLEVDVEGLAEAEQELHRYRPLIALDKVQVARRDVEPLRHLALLEAELLAKAADLVSQQDFPFNGSVGRRHRQNPRNLQPLQIYHYQICKRYSITLLHSRRYGPFQLLSIMFRFTHPRSAGLKRRMDRCSANSSGIPGRPPDALPAFAATTPSPRSSGCRGAFASNTRSPAGARSGCGACFSGTNRCGRSAR